MERTDLHADRGVLPARDPPMLPTASLAEPAAPPATAPTDLWWILGALRRHVRLVLLVTAVVTALAVVVAYRATPLYTAWALVRLQDSRAPIVHGLVDPMEAGPRTLTDPILSEIQVLTSRSVASQVVAHPLAAPLRVYPVGFPFAVLGEVRAGPGETVDSLRLHFAEREVVVTGRGGERRAPYGTPVEMDGVHFTLAERPDADAGLLVVVPADDAVDSLLSALDVSPRARTDLLDVGFTAPDPEVAARIANAAVQVFQVASIEAAQQQARRRRVFMEEQLRQNDSILTIAQGALSSFRGRNRAYSSQQMFAAGQEEISGLDVQRMELQVEQRTYQALLADLTRAREAGAGWRAPTGTLSAAAAGNPVIAQLYTQLLRHQAAYDSLTTGDYRSAESSPDVRRLAALIASSRERLTEAVGSYVASISARLNVLDGVKATRAATFQQLPAAEVEEAQLATRLEVLRQVGEQLRGEYQRTRIEEAVEAGRLSIIDLATVPRGAIGVGPLMKVGLGVVLGLTLGGGLAFLREALTSVIRRREDVEDMLRLPWLAVIPRIRPPQREQRLASRFRRDAQELVSERAFAADAFRLLQVNLAFASEEQTPKVIAVTSATAQDGKTTTAINLAVAYAERGLRTLLVDCDLRRPRLHRLSSRPRDPGLVELLLGCDAPAQVVRTLSPNLWLLAAGAMPPNPAALLGSARMRELLDTLSGEYDTLVLDCPPALLGADAAIVGTLADGVLFVVRAGRTERGLALDAIEQLRRVGGRVIGAALNDPEATIPQYSYGMYEAYADREFAYEPVVQSAHQPPAMQRSR